MAVALLMVGCATKQTYWDKPGATEADYNADAAQCRAQAFSVPGAMNNLMQVAIVQSTCMQGKGWQSYEK